MHQQFLGGLTAALVTATVGVALPSHADQTEDSGQMQTLEGSVEGASSDSLAVSRVVTEDTIVRPPASDPLEELGSDPSESTIASTLSHDFQGRDATTVYVNGIPVLTFLGSEGDVPELDEGITQVTGHIWRATSVASKINQLKRDGIDAETIIAKWNADQEHYAITIGQEELASITDNTILPDTTREPAEDVLQATNRLRRLLGYAPPLKGVEGKPILPPIHERMSGIASWYGPGFHGRQSASGEIFNQNALTAAHRTLPFGTQVRVTNLHNGAQVIVRINDRGPYSGGRVIDLSAAAAQAIGMISSGVASVELEILDRSIAGFN